MANLEGRAGVIQAVNEAYAGGIREGNPSPTVIYGENGQPITSGGTDYPTLVFVESIDDLPAPSNSIITLADEVTYLIITDVNIGDNRLVLGARTVITGFSPENCLLHNTMENEPLITATRTIKIANITLYVAGVGATILDLDAATSPDFNNALDWQYVNFSGGDVGTIANYDNAVFETFGIIDKEADGLPPIGDGFIFDGTIGTVAFTGSFFALFDGANSNTAITIPSTATLSRRLRLNNSAFVSTGLNTSINVSASATIAGEGFVLESVSFSGGGTPLGGIDETDDRALFTDCSGIVNTSSNAYYTMVGNATPTTISATSTPFKLEGLTVGSAITRKFTLTDNRAEYDGSKNRRFLATAIFSLTSGNNNQISVFFGVDGAVIAESETQITTSSAGRVRGSSSQAIFELMSGQYVETFVSNTTGTNDITAEFLSVTLIPIQ